MDTCRNHLQGYGYVSFLVEQNARFFTHLNQQDTVAEATGTAGTEGTFRKIN